MLVFFSCHLASSIVSFLEDELDMLQQKKIPAFIPLVVEWKLRVPQCHPHLLRRQIDDHSASILQKISL